MRVIKPSRIRSYQVAHPASSPNLDRWLELVESCDWDSLQSLREVLPSADAVTVASGRTVTVFNIAGNNFRLVTAIHYNTRLVYVLAFLTHAQYSRNKWKGNL
jgi:mRNA interferase HigB